MDHHDPAYQSLSAADLCILHDKDCQLSDSSDVPSGLFYGSAWMLLVLRKQNLPILYAGGRKEVLTPEEESLRALEAMDRPSPLTEHAAVTEEKSDKETDNSSK